MKADVRNRVHWKLLMRWSVEGIVQAYDFELGNPSLTELFNIFTHQSYEVTANILLHLITSERVQTLKNSASTDDIIHPDADQLTDESEELPVVKRLYLLHFVRFILNLAGN